jgi:hypothetical protein
MLREKIRTTKRNSETVLAASSEVGLEVNAKKSE